MFPKFSKKSPSLLPQSTQQPSSISHIIFVIANIIAGFISAAVLLVCDSVKNQLRQLLPVLTDDLRVHLNMLIILALCATLLHVFGCYCADIARWKPLLVFLVLSSVAFVVILTWLAYFLRSIDAFMHESIEAWAFVGGSDKTAMQTLLGCRDQLCDAVLESEIRALLMELVKSAGLMLVCLLICKFAGSAYIGRVQKKARDETDLIVTYSAA